MSTAILHFFMWLSAGGLALSMVAHIMALAGASFSGDKFVWCLHIGIFVVWLPAVIVMSSVTRFAKNNDVWKVALAGCPVWMRRAMYGLFGYAILNFVISFVATAPERKHPQDPASASIVRGFSGHWMIFYGAAFAVLYSRIHAPQFYRARRCPQGHDASPVDRFCSKCGYEFPEESGSV
jgi:hypothetical protein